jgi:ribonucleotide monophosphatase NagD (HAD superfamily)
MNAIQERSSLPAGLVLVSAPNRAGKQFINQLRQRNMPYYAIVNSPYEKKRLEGMGVHTIITVDTAAERTWNEPGLPIRNVYLFEDSFNLTCRYIRLCKAWKADQIYVITRKDFIKQTYRALGADQVISSSNKEVSFLLKELGKPGKRELVGGQEQDD